ncbi:MAG: DUF4136 domain-containing protein [Gammaproteobacteria bacterium]
MSKMQEVCLRRPTQALLIIFAAIVISLFSHSNLQAEESVLSNISNSGLSWGRKYFFDLPRFKDKNVQEQLDKEITEKLDSYGINLDSTNNSSSYLLNYTILLGDTASQNKIEELYTEETELENISKDTAKFEQGKLLISIRDRDSHKAIWQNSVEGLANLDMSDENRKQRIKFIVDEAFKTFPSE